MPVYGAMSKKSIQFICDEQLGRLARYLRLAGFDTVYRNPIDDAELISIALNEKRFILSRDHRLEEKILARRCLILESDDWMEQFKTVLAELGLALDRKQFFTRCLVDNSATVPVDQVDIKDRIHPYTYEHHTDFRHCPECDRLYWHGSHIKAMMRALTDAGVTVD